MVGSGGSSSNNINKEKGGFRSRSLARGEAWVRYQDGVEETETIVMMSGVEEDNIFLHKNNHNDEQTYVRDGSNYYSSKGSKSGGKGYGKGASDKSYSGKSSKSNYGKGEQEHESSKGSKKSKSKGMGKDSKKTKSKSHGKGGFSFDDDYVYPTPKPTSNPFGPTDPTDPPNPSNPVNPTNPPNPVNTPTASPAEIPKPTVPGRTPSIPPAQKPTNPPKPKPQPSRCSLGPNGLYGEKIGLSTEFRFLYTTQTIPTVDVAALNIDMLPKAETQMGNDLLPKLFPDDCGILNRKLLLDDEDQTRRKLQGSLSLNGMSVKRRDVVDEEGMKDPFNSHPIQDSGNSDNVVLVLTHYELYFGFMEFLSLTILVFVFGISIPSWLRFFSSTI